VSADARTKYGQPLLIVISGPSGVGKDALLAVLRQRRPDAHFTITATTRPQREVNPDDRAFITFLSETQFDSLLESNGFLEHARVYGYRYGVPRQQVTDALAEGKDVFVRVDVQGAATIRRLIPEAVLIFISPPSMDELERRLRSRGLDDHDVIARRLAAAREELARSSQFDHLVVNEQDRLDQTAEHVLEIIEQERVRGRPPPAL
jgi:guanylate kinase